METRSNGTSVSNQVSNDYDETLFLKNSELLHQELVGLVDRFMQNEDALCDFLSKTIKAHAEEFDKGTVDSGEASDEDNPSVIGQLWAELLNDHFANDVRDLVNKYLKPVFCNWKKEDADAFCDQVINKCIGDVLMDVTERIQELDVNTLLIKHYHSV